MTNTEQELLFAYRYYHDIHTGFAPELFKAYEQGALFLIDYWEGKLNESMPKL